MSAHGSPWSGKCAATPLAVRSLAMLRASNSGKSLSRQSCRNCAKGIVGCISDRISSSRRMFTRGATLHGTRRPQPLTRAQAAGAAKG